MKKLLCLALAAAMMLTLVACGGGSMISETAKRAAFPPRMTRSPSVRQYSTPLRGEAWKPTS